jgi:O-antigen/teichoic acid export membrane protein
MSSAAPITPGIASATSLLWRGVILNFASRVVAVLLGLAILGLVARRGPQVQGALSLFVAMEAMLLALGSGLGLLLGREAAQAQGNLSARRQCRILGLAVAVGVAAALLLAVFSHLSANNPYHSLWILALAAPCLLLTPTVNGLWMGQGRLLALNAVQVASPALVLGLLLVSSALGSDGMGVLATWALARATVGLGAAGWALARPVVSDRQLVNPEPTEPREACRFVAVIALANVIGLANYRAVLFLMERMQGLLAAGIYSVAVQLAELLWLFSSAITVSAYSRIGTRDNKDAVAITLRTVRLGLGTTLIVAPLLGLVAWLALPSLLGEAYRASRIPLLLLLPGVVGYAAASGLSAYYTHHRGRPHWAAGIAGLSLALTLSVSAWSVPRWGASGAAAATSVAYLLAISIAFGLFARDVGLRWRSRPADDSKLSQVS